MNLIKLAALIIGLVFPLTVLAKNAELITQKQFLTLQKSATPAIVLDVRSVEEFNAGHIAGAINIAHSSIEENIEQLTSFKDKTIVVYCRSGRRAGIVETYLAKKGFQLKHLEGDMKGWQAANLPVVTNP